MDRTTKALLALIVAGLWINLAVVFFRVTPVIDQHSKLLLAGIEYQLQDISFSMGGIEMAVTSIESDVEDIDQAAEILVGADGKLEQAIKYAKATGKGAALTVLLDWRIREKRGAPR